MIGSPPLSVQYIISMLSIGFTYMTPSQLRAFHLVAESGSFSAAARDSGLSQPNLSGQVTALEKAYGIRLFDRRGRSVVPTETGRQLQGITSRLFAVQEEAQALLEGEQTLTRGHLRIAADSAHHVVPIMAALKKRAGSLTFALSIDNSAIVLERLLRHEADVAVMAKSVSDPRLHAIRLRTDRLVLFVPAGHALAKRRSAPLAALADQELVLRERGSITREVLEQAMAAADIRPRVDRRRADPRGRARGGGGRLRHRRHLRERAGRGPALPAGRGFGCGSRGGRICRVPAGAATHRAGAGVHGRGRSRGAVTKS